MVSECFFKCPSDLFSPKVTRKSQGRHASVMTSKCANASRHDVGVTHDARQCQLSLELPPTFAKILYSVWSPLVLSTLCQVLFTIRYGWVRCGSVLSIEPSDGLPKNAVFKFLEASFRSRLISLIVCFLAIAHQIIPSAECSWWHPAITNAHKLLVSVEYSIFTTDAPLTNLSLGNR